MRALCKALAQFHQQDKAKAEGRWIFHESDFTKRDREEIAETAKMLPDFLRSLNGLPWHDVFTIENGKMIIHESGALRAISAVLPGTFIGFKMQDRIIARCKANGIIFK